jgi:hypothetical protein
MHMESTSTLMSDGNPVGSNICRGAVETDWLICESPENVWMVCCFSAVA